MKQSLQLRLGQQLTMTPQLQQAIRLLQLSSLDLQAEVQTILDSNLMLERSDEPQELPVQPEALAAQVAADTRAETEIEIGTVANDTLPDELPVDSSWDDIYDPSDGATSYSRGEDEDWDPCERYAGAGESLREHLYWQMRLTPFNDRDMALATAIIDAIDESGYLTLSLEEICQGPREQFAVTLAEAEAVLKLVQHFDPQGVGARSPARVELNPDSTPKVRINARYAALARRAGQSSGDSNCLKNHLQEARWFLKSLQNRNETLLKVATCIVERQREFLERGDEHMKPLILRDIAEVLGLHESTISRVTTQKYMHTPRGLYELKFFFSSHVGTSDGGECSSTAIRAMIRKLIQAEDAGKPLSDDKIAKLLETEGIQVARRTVAKYREAMSIPSSSDRKRLV
ncbi:MAG: RNA polymerase sigma-54 factor [Candidatus Competibacteraceae bacterium]|nr:RNA polymerase sigma-54 factor [Candidatus Competibacteraceae bacterium]